MNAEKPCDDRDDGSPLQQDQEEQEPETDLQSMSCCSTSTETNFSNSCSTTSTSTSTIISTFFETKCNLSSKPHKSNDPAWAALTKLRSETTTTTDTTLSLDNFKFLKRLGSGDIGSVYLTELKGTTPGLLLAMKVMDNRELITRNKLARAKTEREILEMVDHPFLPTLYAQLHCNRWSCLVTEFCPGGDLHVLRQSQPGKRFAEASARFYAAEVVVALEYIHMLGIVYRDLKPENVLVREDGHIMLTDFDLSLKSDQPTTTTLVIPAPVSGTVGPDSCVAGSCILPNCIAPAMSCFHLKKRRTKRNTAGKLPELLVEPVDTRSMSFVGTHEYLAPEIISGEGHGNAVDWWTLGIFLFELLYGVTPFKGADNDATLANVVARGLEFPREVAMSSSARDLIGALLVKDPSQRMGSTRGAAQIKQHHFFNGVNWALLRCTAPPYLPPPFDVVHVAEDAELLDEETAVNVVEDGELVDDDGDGEASPVEYY